MPCWSSRVSARQLLKCRTLQNEARSGTGRVTVPYMVEAPPTSASYSDSAHPVGLEFWLPGKVPLLGDRGLSFVCFHPILQDAKGLSSTSPVSRNTSIVIISFILSSGAGAHCQKWSIQLKLFCCCCKCLL